MGRLIRPDAGRSRVIKARNPGDNGLQQAARQLVRALRDEQARRDSHAEALSRGAIDLAIGIARHLLQGELRQDRDAILGLAAPLLKSLHRASQLTISAHPTDAARLREALSAQASRTEPEETTINVHDAPDLARGSLRIDSDIGSLDGRLSVRLGHIASTLSRAVGEAT